MTSVNAEPQLATAESESVTLTWMLGKLPETDGVPLMMPVPDAMVRPVGSEPVSENVYAGVPPDADGVAPV
jgi:hypothetical protein